MGRDEGLTLDVLMVVVHASQTQKKDVNRLYMYRMRKEQMEADESINTSWTP